ncbi:MAG: oligopeptide transporter, OPT family, partial [Bacteroidia bacterium]|nr:oligopeptide transporter, OPT family [Bacteroidia bacterium]
FIGGIIKGIVDIVTKKKGFNDAQKARVENVGILIAAGFIAGEALTGLAFAPFKIAEMKILQIFANPSTLFYVLSFVILIIIALALIWIPVKNAGSPDEPAPPAVSM